MKCEIAQQNLKAFADNETSRRERIALRLHLLRCESCRAELEAIRTTSEQFAKFRTPAPSDNIRDYVLQKAQELRPACRARRPVLKWIAATVGATGIIIALTIFIMTRPTPAQAAMQRVLHAADDVRSAHLEMWFQPPGEQREIRKSWYADGKWRMEEWKEDKLVSASVYVDKTRRNFSSRTNTIYISQTNQPFGTPFRGFSANALLSPEAIGPDADIAIKGIMIKGTQLEQFTVTKQTERWMLFADKKTHLPVDFKIYTRSEKDWDLAGGTLKIEFNIPLDSQLFVLTPAKNTRVIDKAEWDKQWLERYTQGMGRKRVASEEVVLRDFQVTSIGDVFAVWTGLGNREFKGTLTLIDNLGTVYLPQTNYYIRNDGAVWFIPLIPPASQPSWYVMTLNAYEIGDCSFQVTKPVFSPGSGPLHPIFRTEKGWFDFYTPGDGAQSDVDRIQARATYWEQHENIDKVIQYYEEMIRIADTKIHKRYFRPGTWVKIAKTYTTAGLKEKAIYAYKRGLESASLYRRDSDSNESVRIIRKELQRLENNE